MMICTLHALGAMLAEAPPPPDTMISGSWIIAAIGAVSTAAVGIIGKMKVDEAKRTKTSTVLENQPLAVSLVDTLATKDELRELEARLVSEIKKLEAAIANERSVARIANGNLHARIDKSTEGIAEMKGQLTQMNANLNRVLDLMINPLKPKH